MMIRFFRSLSALFDNWAYNIEQARLRQIRRKEASVSLDSINANIRYLRDDITDELHAIKTALEVLSARIPEAPNVRRRK